MLALFLEGTHSYEAISGTINVSCPTWRIHMWSLAQVMGKVCDCVDVKCTWRKLEARCQHTSTPRRTGMAVNDYIYPALGDSTPAPAGVSLVVPSARATRAPVGAMLRFVHRQCNEVKATHASISFSFVSAIVYMRRSIDIFSRPYGRAFR